MRKIIACVTLFMYLFTSCFFAGTVAFAATDIFTEGGFSYTVEDGYTTIVGCTLSGDVIVPSELGGTVIAIGNNAFAEGTFTSIALPDTLETIGRGSFSDCSNFSEITIPEGVFEIGATAFEGCSSLSAIYLPESLESIGSRAFDGTAFDFTIYAKSGTYAEEYALDNDFAFVAEGNADNTLASGYCGAAEYVLYKDGSLVVFGEGAMTETPWWEYADEILTVHITENVTNVSECAFEGYSNLTTVVIDAYLDEIGMYAFSDCQSLRSVTINGGVKRIGESAFSNCTILGSIVLPSDLENLQQEAFAGCDRLAYVEFTGHIDAIADLTFYNCYNLETVILPETLKAIGEQAFSDCAKLAEITLGEYMLFIAYNAFDCVSSDFVMHGYNGTLADIYSRDYEWTFDGENCEAVEILSGEEPGGNGSWSLNSMGELSVIGSGNILYCDWRYTQYDGIDGFSINYITKATISEGITGISEYAFNSCGYLEEITLPSTLLFVDKGALSYCSSDLVVKGYENTPAKKLVEGYGFAFESLGTVAEEVLFSDDWWTLTNTGKLSVNTTNISKYTIRDAMDYKGAVREVTLDQAINIEDDVFAEFTALEKVTFPDTILYIGANNFTDSEELTVIGYEGTAAETFAEENGYTFESLGEATNAVIASGDCGENVTWKLERNGILTISGEGEMYDVPEEWDTYASNIKKVVVEEGITDICNSAFRDKENLTEVILPNSLSSLGDYVFYNCDSLKEITIDYHITSLGYYILGYSSETVIKGYAGSYAEYYAEKNGYTFESIGQMPEEVLLAGDDWELTTTGKLTFSGKGEIDCYEWLNAKQLVKEVVVGEGVTEINSYTFDNCERLTKVTLPESLTRIGMCAFDGVPITEISLGDNITYLGECAFRNTLLERVTLPESLTTISPSLFSDCEKLTEVTIPFGVAVIKDGAFSRCTALTEITIPYSVMVMEDDIFDEDILIKGYTGSEVADYADANGLSFESIGSAVGKSAAEGVCGEDITWSVGTDKVLTLSGSGDMNYYYYSDYIPWDDFAGYIEKVVISDEITSICDYVFQNTSIKEISIPDSIKNIPYYAFGDCPNLETVEIPYTVSQIDDYAFYNCSSNMVIKGYEGSAAEAFAEKWGYTFESLGETPEGTIAEGTLDGISWELNNRGVLTVTGEGEITDTAPWNDYCYEIKSAIFTDGITGIGECAFAGAENMVSVQLPSTLKEIEVNSFYSCSSLKEIIIPSGVKKIDSEAFAWCTSLEEVVLPEGLETLEYGAFSYCRSLAKINIPDSLTTISGYAFQDTLISEITIPYTVISIGERIFNYCEHEITIKGYDNSAAYHCAQKDGHTYVSLGEMPLYTVAEGKTGELAWKLDSYGNFVLSGNGETDFGDNYYDEVPWEEMKGAIRNVTIEEGVTAIGQNAFENCENLVSVSLPDTLEELGRYAFSYCSSLKEVTIPKNVSYAEYAFRNCQSLERVTFAEGTTIVDDDMFSNCGSLKTVVLPDTIKTIGNNAFEYCYELSDITIPSGVTVIKRYAFFACDALEEIVLPTGLKKIEENAFRNAGISKITIPYTVSIIESNALPYNPTLTICGYDGTVAETFASENGYVFESLGKSPVQIVASGEVSNYIDWELDSQGVLTLFGDYEMPNLSNGAQPWYSYQSDIKKVVITDGIYTVSGNSFKGCTNLESVSLPESVSSIGNHAFYGCEKLSDINFPAKLSGIGAYAFYGCGMETVSLGQGLSYLDSNSFSNCLNLTEVNIGDSIKEIYNSFNGCTSLESVTISYKTTYVSDTAFAGCTNLTIKGYEGSVAEEYALNNDIPFESIGIMPVYEIASGSCGDSATFTLDSIGTLKITGSGVVRSGDFSSYNGSIKKLILEGVEEINSYVFRNYYSLKEITLPDTLRVIGYAAFSGCSSLEEVVLPESIEMVSGEAFANCTSLKRITIPFSLDQISWYTFDGVPSGMTIVGYEDSMAQSIAESQGFQFESLGVVERVELGSGKCGEDLFWAVDNYGVLDIYGSGDMYDFTEDTVPWKDYKFKHMELDEDITKIGAYAFMNRNFYDGYILPDGIVEIGDYAFYGTGEMNNSFLPKSLKILGDYAFGEVWMRSVYDMGGLTSIGEGAFSGATDALFFGTSGSVLENYAAENDMHFLPFENSGKCGDNLSWSVSALTGELVLTGSGATYDYIVYSDEAAPWTDYADAITSVCLPEGLTHIGENVFCNMWQVEEIDMPSTLVSIGNGGFFGSSFRRMVLKEGFTSLGANAFRYGGPDEIYLPRSLTEIDSQAFGSYWGTLYVYENSVAHTFAINNGLDFVLRSEGIPVIQEVYAENDGGGVYVEVTTSGAFEENVLIAGLYNEDGRMVNLSLVYNGFAYLKGAGDYVKVMCWNSLEGMHPAAKAVTAAVN